MMNNAQPPAPHNFAARLLPWVVAAGTLVLYALTINHWMSLFNLGYVAKVSGWTWQPEIINPISFIVTYPFRWLPTASIPFALNLFSAVCAALTLGLLARSVALLPQDRTRAQREREHSDFSLLTIRAAWLPPIFAALVCGLQMTFWEQATNFTGEMFELLLFAFVIWLLLEYRIDGREWRLFLAAFVYGAAMTDNWAMTGFFLPFITAVIWIRGVSFFNFGFLSRMALCGLVGISFYLLLPLLAVISAKMPITFWQALKYNLAAPSDLIKFFFVRSDVRATVGLISLSSLLPVLALSIRTKSFFGGGVSSGINEIVERFTFHLIYGVFLVVCVWVAFDPSFSPRNIFPRQFGITLSFLTFYYLGALSIGYYSGYFLLVFGTKKSRSHRHKTHQVPALNYIIVAMVWLLFLIAVTGLVYKNAPQIHAVNDDTLKKYAALVEEKLPAGGAILLSDDTQRLLFVQAALVCDGKAENFVPLDTKSLVWPAYHKFLHKRYPQKFPDTIVAAETNEVSPLHLILLLAALAKTNELYYLHPSFGYYFEQFYLEPHGLVYKLKTLPNETLLPPLPDENQIAENEAFWSNTETTVLAPIQRSLAPTDPNAPVSWPDNLLAFLQVSRGQNPSGIVAGTFYSRSLDFWGVQLQRAGEFEKAAAQFQTAEKLNPGNVVAQINLDFNKTLSTGKTTPVDLSKTTLDQLGKYRTWGQVLNANGPFDEPSFCFENGVVLVQGGLTRQAVESFARVRELSPDSLSARLMLGELYVANHLPDRALEEIREIRNQPERFSLTETNEPQLALIEASAYMEKTNFSHATRLIETTILRSPTNNILLATAVQLYTKHGLFTNALDVINDKLQSTPDDAGWLFMKGYIDIQIKNYDDAISSLSQVLSTQTNNATARFNRAIAYLDSGKLDDARADYESLQQSFTNSFQVDYRLGEIAWRKHETNDAIRYYELYLANANTNTAEATNIMQRLRELKK
jgi:tetratricopeptide (TPR) repeat protein